MQEVNDSVECAVNMMTSSNGSIFRVTGPLCGEFTDSVTRSFDVFFDLRLNKRLSKQPWGWWFETPSWSLWRQCNEDVQEYMHIIWGPGYLDDVIHVIATHHQFIVAVWHNYTRIILIQYRLEILWMNILICDKLHVYFVLFILHDLLSLDAHCLNQSNGPF